MSKQLEKNQRYIYVLLTGTNTIVAKLIRLYTKEPYSHASIALDAELKQLYSFARKQRFNPLNSGFVMEDLEKGVFGADKKANCGVYEVPVTEEQYEYICEEIGRFINNQDHYKYNYFGLFSAMFGKEIQDDTHFLCSQFVNHVFFNSGIQLFADEKGLVRPFHFHGRLKDNQIYAGKLCEYRKKYVQNIASDDGEYAKAM